VREIRRGWVTGLAFAALLLAVACGRRPEPLRLAGPTMGTTYSISIPQLPADVPRASVESVIADVLRETEVHLSGWNVQSELARFNAHAGTDWQSVSPVLYESVAQALAVSRVTNGAFDITVGPLVRAWGFGSGADADPAVPSAPAIAELLRDVGYARLELRARPPALRKTSARLALDLDGIAPGWAVDRIAGRLEALGIHDYLVELGGEVRARGLTAEGRRWRIAVERPATGERRPLAVIELDGVGVSTSGDYRDYRVVNGRRISHTIDPRTGAPVAHGLASVTVVHGSVAAADAWATALMVLGPEEGMALARRWQLAALFVRRGAEAGVFIESETPEFARLRLPEAARL
jgi:thiamine biosynthesis lipoprotein